MTAQSENRATIAEFAGDGMTDAVIVALESAYRTIFDPEIPVNIYEMGLVYTVTLDAEKKAKVRMTLTAPNCPAAESLPVDVKRKTESIEGIAGAEVEVVWEPMWTPEKMTEAAKLELGML